ncbi:hypothetical protein ACHAQJ_005824 [Trichoderma viride]
METLRPLGSESGDKGTDASTSADAMSTYSPQSSRTTTSSGTGLSFTDVLASVDPFLHDSLRRPTVDIIVQKQLLKIIGSRNEMYQIANSYFASISRRLSIVSAQRFYGRLPKIESSQCTADFSALYLNLSMGESILTTPFAQETDPLPIEEGMWSQNIAPSLVTHTLNTPADISIGSFARECQISHLVGRVLRNVYEPVSDEAFQAKEANQLETTMSTFIPLLQNDVDDFGKYCISFAICARYYNQLF